MYKEEVVMKVFPMHHKFDIILGCDWCRALSFDILYLLILLHLRSGRNCGSLALALKCMSVHYSACIHIATLPCWTTYQYTWQVLFVAGHLGC